MPLATVLSGLAGEKALFPVPLSPHCPTLDYMGQPSQKSKNWGLVAYGYNLSTREMEGQEFQAM